MATDLHSRIVRSSIGYWIFLVRLLDIEKTLAFCHSPRPLPLSPPCRYTSGVITLLRRWPRAAVAAVLLCLAPGATTQAAQPEGGGKPFLPRTELDHLFLDELGKQGLTPAPLCTDGEFMRRAYLDLIGTLPPAAEARQFLKDDDPAKRARLVDELLAHERFNDYWTLKWCDLLRVKAEYPINLWPNGVQAYARWIHECLVANMPCDAFARALLTSSGSNFRTPAVNFYRALQGNSAAELASVVALTLMGTRLETWPEAERTQFEAIFSRVAFKGTAEWKETIVHLDPAPAPPLKLTLPDGVTLTCPSDKDPRVVFADWLLDPENEWFARNLTNRAWSWFFGRGLIHETDDIRPDNPPVHPQVLKYLEKEFARTGYDLRYLFRIIVTSAAYQQSCVPTAAAADATRLFARYPIRRLDAEVLLDALEDFSGNHDHYSSQIPEPFTFVPDTHRNIQLTDGSITSPFLKMFGRPARDTGLEAERSRQITKEQRLHLINSSHIMNKLNRSGRLSQGKTRDEQLDSLYLATLTRYPTPQERTVARDYLSRGGKRSGQQDLLWALINSKEFLYQH